MVTGHKAKRKATGGGKGQARCGGTQAGQRAAGWGTKNPTTNKGQGKGVRGWGKGNQQQQSTTNNAPIHQNQITQNVHHQINNPTTQSSKKKVRAGGEVGARGRQGMGHQQTPPRITTTCSPIKSARQGKGAGEYITKGARAWGQGRQAQEGGMGQGHQPPGNAGVGVKRGQGDTASCGGKGKANQN